MAAMKPRTGDGPLEVTKEGRGIVMRVPLEGGGRLVVELSADEANALGDALKSRARLSVPSTSATDGPGRDQRPGPYRVRCSCRRPPIRREVPAWTVAPPTVTTDRRMVARGPGADVLAAAVAADYGQLSLGPGAVDVLELAVALLGCSNGRGHRRGRRGHSRAVSGRPGLERVLLVGRRRRRAPADCRRGGRRAGEDREGHAALASTAGSTPTTPACGPTSRGCSSARYGFHRRSSRPRGRTRWLVPCSTLHGSRPRPPAAVVDAAGDGAGG